MRQYVIFIELRKFETAYVKQQLICVQGFEPTGARVLPMNIEKDTNLSCSSLLFVFA